MTYLQGTVADLHNQQIHCFDRVIPLQRTAARLVQLGYQRELMHALTERVKPDLRTYTGAKNLPSGMFARLTKYAGQHHVYVWDPTPVEPANPSEGQAERDASAADLARLLQGRRLTRGIGSTVRRRDTQPTQQTPGRTVAPLRHRPRTRATRRALRPSRLAQLRSPAPSNRPHA